MSRLLWKEKELSPLRIILDPQNPRIEVPEGANQAVIRKKLIEYGRVVTLANSIIDFGGLLPGERIIVCKENKLNDRYTVLEGNRRVCACQLILDKNYLPENLKRRMKRVTHEVKENVSKIRAEIAPTRDDAEPVITKRHTEVGVLTWNTNAKMRRASRLLEEGYSLDDIAEKLSASKQAIKTAIREYRLFKYAINLEGWNDQEIDILTDEGLKTNPYTRFFNVKGVREKLGLAFDENDHITTTIPDDHFKKLMRHIARCFLIPVPENKNKPIANTRSTADEIFALYNPDDDKFDLSAKIPELADKGTQATSTRRPRRTKPKSAVASVFFEKLTCAVQDDRLIGITDEISRIDYADMPIAASMLLRGLLESALYFQVKHAKKVGELQKFVQEKNNGKIRDVGLADLIKFCGDKRNGVFIYPRAADALRNSSVSVYKEQLDIIIHGKWAQADDSILIKAATALRPIITHILEGQDYTVEV